MLIDNQSNFKSSQNTKAYKDAFALFDKKGNGRIPAEALGDLLRAVGQNPTLAEIDELETTVSGDCMFIVSCEVLNLSLI